MQLWMPDLILLRVDVCFVWVWLIQLEMDQGTKLGLVLQVLLQTLNIPAKDRTIKRLLIGLATLLKFLYILFYLCLYDALNQNEDNLL